VLVACKKTSLETKLSPLTMVLQFYNEIRAHTISEFFTNQRLISTLKLGIHPDRFFDKAVPV